MKNILHSVWATAIFFFLFETRALAQMVAPVLSPRAQVFMNEAWGDSSFVRGLAIMADGKETRDSRSLAMELLHTDRLKLKPNEMRQFLVEVTAIAKNDTADEKLSAQAVHTMGNLTLTMEELGQLSRAEATKEVGFVMNIATDVQRSMDMRSQAIVVLGILKISQAAPILVGVLNANLNVPQIASPACLSLMRIDRERAVSVLANVLQKTTDSRVFGTAAFALGQIKNRESMSALVQNLERFPESSSCDAALVDMELVVLEVLKNSQDQRLNDAIRATRYLWHEGQRGRYIPILHELLRTAPPAARKAALERLLEEASTQEFDLEKRELAAILELIKDQAQLSEYQERIRGRLSASLLMPSSGPTAPVFVKPKGER